MPEAPPPPEAPPHLRSAVHRYRSLLARGCPAEAALADLVAYLTVLRPGLPRVLAQEQADAVVALAGAGRRTPAHPPRGLLEALSRPAE
ncbi:hypothetical protein [Paracraurococcus lichenis]|uniref:Uncharacterized protein n=1 Tax=Paracraurococcus lichenis TaxID=3064888 RepID=A0ABT9DVU7_9PROT|nr:hypothetical protein [Paracraurococcus sp. LOR1-02]MDO9708026.1 hypothetical protein [Paracraurococcus sp. LOR1-02]